jgi:hypothetical protein
MIWQRARIRANKADADSLLAMVIVPLAASNRRRHRRGWRARPAGRRELPTMGGGAKIA